MTAALHGVVIVGGGIAGVSTAGALRAGGYDGDVMLVDAGEFPYDKPPLSKQYLSGEFDFDKLLLQSPQWYDHNNIRLLTSMTVEALRPALGAVELADGSLVTADRVVLATGGQPARPSIPGAQSRRVHVLRSSRDADALRKELSPGARLLIVGAGLIGAEVGSTALDLGCDVTLADPVPTPLAGAVGEEFATWLHGMHRARGITVITTGVRSLIDGRRGITADFGCEQKSAEFDVVLLAVGMVPDTALAQRGGLQTDNGIVVDAGQTTSNPAVLAVGDPTRIRVEGVLRSRTEHWDAAQRDGQRAAATILGSAQPATTAPWFWTDRHHRHVEVVGSMAEAQNTVVRGTFDGPSVAVFGLREDRIVAAAAADEPNTVRAARRLIDRRVSVDAGALADPATDLRACLRAEK